MIKRTFVLLLAILMLATVGCAESAPAQKQLSFTEGTYTAEGIGNNGKVTISVTFSANEITEVIVGEHGETAGIADPAIERIPTAIVEEQTLAVDVIAGATNTSKAILEAVENCVKQAGGDVDAMKVFEEPSELNEEQLVTDVVIVGAGISGIMAGYEFRNEYPNVDFLILEKLDFVTGSLPSTGGVIAGLSSEIHEKEGISTSIQDFSELFSYTSGVNVNSEFVESVFEKSDLVLNNLTEWGVPFNGIRTVSNYSKTIYGLTVENAGAGAAAALREKIKKDGFEIRTGTKVTELIVEDGVVKGVIAQDKNTLYEIRCDIVLLATGGFGSNPELMAELCPAYAATNPAVKTNAGATGDGIALTRQFNTKIVGEGIMGSARAADGNTAVTSKFLVNGEGSRFIGESEQGSFILDEIVFGQNATAYFLIDSNYSNTTQLQEKIDSGILVPYNSLEEMADALGMDKDKLTSTVEAYNKAVDAGENPEFGLPVANATKVETAPFYADKTLPMYFATIPGIEINNSCQVLDGNGNVVPGLYASGELTAGNAFSRRYPGAGLGIAYAANSGRFAAENIAAELNK